MLKTIRSRIGRTLAALVRPYLERSPESGRERIVLAPVMTAPCVAHHHMLEGVIRLLVRSEVATPALLAEFAREVTERCHYEMYGKDAHVAIGIVEGLMDQLRGSAGSECGSSPADREVRISGATGRDGWGYPTSDGGR
jgi:hypothetical protein